MSVAEHKIVENQPVIRQLDDAAANRIAAGEVVERPASAVKELVENAIDAGASRVEISIADGGKTLIRVADDGHGIAQDQLELALSRHATSKIDGSDLLAIHTFGFRGEALPSLGAVGRMTLISRAAGSHQAAEIAVNCGQVGPKRPAALNAGTVVALRDLFHATPARLKFLRSDRAETQAVSDVVRRLAMAEPYVGFVLRDVTGGGDGRVLVRADPCPGDLFDALHGRLRQIMGTAFVENALAIDAERDGLTLTGYAALPTYSRGAAVSQFLFVNGRPVRDKLLTGALRGAYADFLSRDRHPAAALFVECPSHMVDVNVHPAKAEVRFREPGLVRGLIVSAVRNALAGAGHRASSTVAMATLGAIQTEPVGGYPQASYSVAPSLTTKGLAGFAEADVISGHVDVAAVEVVDQTALSEHPLGSARAQLFENYIVAQTGNGMVLVDQHAAHERLVYESLKTQIAASGIATQVLLVPEIIELSADDRDRILAVQSELQAFGLVIEPFGGNAICLRETPAILGQIDYRKLVGDVIDELTDQGSSSALSDRIDAILSRIACHGSIRSGRRMNADEMNALLRKMESTPHSGQCNHGRPTYVELKLADIERLFGRS